MRLQIAGFYGNLEKNNSIVQPRLFFVSGVSSCTNLTPVESPSSSCSSQPGATGEGFRSVSPAALDVSLPEFTDSDLLDEVLDQFGESAKSGNVTTTSNSVDSIIGLALGTALDSNGTSSSVAGINHNSSNSFLETLSGLKSSRLDLDPSTTLSTEVHIEELNSGVSGCGVSSSVTSQSLENILNPVLVNGHSAVSTNSGVFLNNTTPICSIVDSQSQQGMLSKGDIPEGNLLLSSSTDTGLGSTFSPQWLNGEVKCLHPSQKGHRCMLHLEQNNIQLSPEGEVNSGGYIPRREASRYISTARH